MYYIFLFWIGGLMYQIVEMLWSGKSHWSMFLLGGFCIVVINCIFENLGFIPIILLGGVVITTFEYIFGFFVNVKCKQKIWDYSNEKFNCNGQICLMYSFFWMLLAPVALGLGRLIETLMIT